MRTRMRVNPYAEDITVLGCDLVFFFRSCAWRQPGVSALMFLGVAARAFLLELDGMNSPLAAPPHPSVWSSLALHLCM